MKYILYLIFDIVVCGFFMGILYLDGKPILLVPLLFSFAFGLVFVPLVIIRLPIFKKYYLKDINSLEIKITSMPERKAAVVLVGLITAAVLAVILYFLNVEQFGYYFFCAGIAAGIISEYYAPQF